MGEQRKRWRAREKEREWKRGNNSPIVCSHVLCISRPTVDITDRIKGTFLLFTRPVMAWEQFEKECVCVCVGVCVCVCVCV